MTQTEAIVRLVHETFGKDVVGLYLHGSAVLGGLRPHSDTDVLAVLQRPTTHEERRSLVERLMAISGKTARDATGRATGARPIELTLVVRSEVVPWRYPPTCDFQYGEWLREAYERGQTPAPAPSPDLAPLLTMVLQADAPLAGPPPAQVLAPVPQGDLNRALVAGVPDLLDEVESDTRNVLLTLARIWMTLTTGTITSKDAAADWALARLPREHRPVLAHARAVYLGDEEEAWRQLLPRLAPHTAYVAAAIDRATAEPSTGLDH